MKCPKCNAEMRKAYQSLGEPQHCHDTGAIEEPVKEYWVCDGCKFIQETEIPY